MTRVAAIAAYLATLLALDTQVSLRGQLVLGALTWVVLLAAARPLPTQRRAQVAVVICAATVAEVTGSIIWGVYTYRLHNLPTFVPPAHGLVFIGGLALSDALRRHTRALVVVAAVAATTWGVLGLTVLPRTDAAGALGVPLLLAFLWRSRARAAYAGSLHVRNRRNYSRSILRIHDERHCFRKNGYSIWIFAHRTPTGFMDAPDEIRPKPARIIKNDVPS